ncbi:hypothetical protein [Streptomyces sp. NPDC049555]|uniref:hypothetical protein n=1 Tax=Streptomyces sp. NPDC049555 TaxID=3154930 RepID=UPI00343071E7
MASEALRAKILLGSEKEKASRVAGGLVGASLEGYRRGDDFPDWVPVAQKSVLYMDSVPDARIPDSVDDAEVDAWCVGVLASAGVTGRFYCSTGMANFPWAEVRVLGEGWMRSLRSLLGSDLYFLAADRTSMVAIFEEEYEYVAFVRRDGA